jgi:hypothetical protein
MRLHGVDADPPAQAPGQPYSLAFFRALATLDAHGVAPDHAAAVTAAWQFLVIGAARAGWLPAEPELDLTADGAVRLVWAGARHYLHLDIHPDGSFEWFSGDPDDPRKAEGSRAPERTLAPAVAARLREVSTTA